MSTRPGRLVTPQWFHWMADAPPRPSIAPRVAGVIGILVGAALIASDRILLGSVVIALAAIVGAISFLSPVLSARINRGFDWAGLWLARIISWTLLTPLFVVVFSAVRLWNRLTGQDPLRLIDRDEPSYWIPADTHERKVRYATAMFATHRRRPRRITLAAFILVLVGGVAFAEGFLRYRGFGKPVLYVSDPQIGFYPRPNQVTVREGGRVAINAFGMRGPQYARGKTAGTFRVLMLGDSTLYGGSYVDQDELYSRRLEAHLRKAVQGRRVEVLAMGVNAWGPFHELGYVEKFGSFDADLAIIALPVGDVYRPLYGLEAVPFLSAQRPPRLALEEVLNHLAWRLRTAQIGPPSADQQEWNRRRGLAAYVRLARMLSQRGAEVMFEILPTRRASVRGTPVPFEVREVERLRATLAAAGPYHVAFPAGIFRHASGRLYRDEIHLHVDGHRLYSEFLRNDIAAHSAKWKRWASTEGAR